MQIVSCLVSVLALLVSAHAAITLVLGLHLHDAEAIARHAGRVAVGYALLVVCDLSAGLLRLSAVCGIGPMYLPELMRCEAGFVLVAGVLTALVWAVLSHRASLVQE
jgi:hypothetical protein